MVACAAVFDLTGAANTQAYRGHIDAESTIEPQQDSRRIQSLVPTAADHDFSTVLAKSWQWMTPPIPAYSDFVGAAGSNGGTRLGLA